MIDRLTQAVIRACEEEGLDAQDVGDGLVEVTAWAEVTALDSGATQRSGETFIIRVMDWSTWQTNQ